MKQVATEAPVQESHSRSIAKTVSWRMTGTTDTILIAYFFTGHIAEAVSIGASELVTKMLLYYFHERIWQKITFGTINTEGYRSHVRSVGKGISWRVVGTMDTMMLSYFVTGRMDLAFGIGSVEVFSKLALYYVHERIWQKITFGRRLAPVPQTAGTAVS